MALPDGELMRRIQCRDAKAFDALYARHRRAISARLASMVRDEAAAGDLLQEAFVRVWSHAGQWAGRGAVKSWLLRIATNLALNHLRTLRRRRESDLGSGEGADDRPWPDQSDEESPDELVERTERQAVLAGLVRDLPSEMRQVIDLVHGRDLGIQGAAESLGIPPGTVKSRLHYARKRLLQHWREVAPEWLDD